ncbi:MAG: choice-of-anchor X domain-containing protein [bacterium]
MKRKKRKTTFAKTILICMVCLLSPWIISKGVWADQNDAAHQTHLSAARGPGLGADCAACHTTGTPSAADVGYFLCIPCHSPAGAYDGLDDAVIGARANWGSESSAIYEADGSLKSGKEKWCVGCHDDGLSIIQGIRAPNISGQSMSGDWQGPVSLVSSDIPGAENLLDGNPGTGNTGNGSYLIVDLGDTASISHLRLFITSGTQVHWDVYGGSDLVSWTRILFGQSVLFGSPTWLTGPDGGWNESRADRFLSIRYLKLVKVSPWPLSGNCLGELEVKKDLAYGYYDTGHKIGCSRCHDTSGVHSDGLARTYEAGLNNYRTGYRLNEVEVDGQMVTPLEIPRVVGCNSGENPRTDNDFALCFACHDKIKLLGDPYGTGMFFQDPPATNFRNDDHVDGSGKVMNEHLRHLRGRYYCGSGLDWDSDWDGVTDSPQSCPACHNVHGSPNPAMTRHGELAGTQGAVDKVPQFNFRYLNAEGKPDTALSNVMDSIGGQTQFYGAGPGTVDKNHVCSMCHNDMITYYRNPVPTCQGCHASYVETQASHCTHLQADRGPNLECWDCHAGSPDQPHTFVFADGKPLGETEVCNPCHSQGGSYDGVDDPDLGAKPNWEQGVYQGNSLKPGKEKWCATCHDQEPAYSQQSFTTIIIDDPQAVLSPDCAAPPGNPAVEWAHASGNEQQYGDGYRYKDIGSGSGTVTWTPDIPLAGEYSVYARWVDSTSLWRATNAPYTVYYSGGSETIRVDQRRKEDGGPGGGQWHYLGTWNFSAGTSGRVVLSDDADHKWVIADAVKFVSGPKGTYAPNIVGNDTDYGFYKTGHKIDCLACHDATKTHLDHQHRTYEVDEGTGQATFPYTDSYRLREIDGLPAMNLPRPVYPPATSPHNHWQDFALCFDCHNRYEVLGENGNDVSHTNFWNNDSSIGNSHWIHLSIYTKHFDSDWDGASDSTESCISCHNVHGSPTGPMIRHGELISPSGTSQYTPALNFFYLTEGDGSATATFTHPLAGGTYDVYAWWSDNSNRSTCAKYIINYQGGSDSVIVDQEQNGGQWNLLGQYPFAAGSEGSVVLTSEGANEYIMADAIKWDRTDAGDTVIVDDPNASYVGTWALSTSNPEQYGSGSRYCYAPVKDSEATIAESFGGTFSVGAILTSNHVCQMCHNYVQYSRIPKAGPRIVLKNADPSGVSNDQSTPVLFTVFVSDRDDNLSSVVIDLTPLGGNPDRVMYDDGSNGDVTADDGTFSYRYSVPSGIDCGPKTLTVTATDALGLSGQGGIPLTVTQPGAIIVDNPDAVFAGTWTESTSYPDRFEDSYHYHSAGSGTDTATWTVTIPAAGNYDVHAWWTADSSRATDAKYTVFFEGGSQEVVRSQQIKGGCWNHLGTWFFLPGEYAVVLSDDADGYVIADAIKWAPENGPVLYPFPVSDNPDAHYVGPWKVSDVNSDNYAADMYYLAAGSGGNNATWTLAVPEAGNYNVYAWWSASDNRAADALYTITYEGGSETVEVCQQVRGGRWNYLGNFPFLSAHYTVVLTDEATDYNSASSGPFVIADAIRFEAGSAPAHPYPIADNWDAVFAGPWLAASWTGGGAFYGSDYQYHAAGSGACSVTWTTDIPEQGSYHVYARWTASSNRATNAPYTIFHGGGSDVVTVNQRSSGGQWVLLGTYTFPVGTYSVVLSDQANGYVIADAVWWEKVNP